MKLITYLLITLGMLGIMIVDFNPHSWYFLIGWTSFCLGMAFLVYEVYKKRL